MQIQIKNFQVCGTNFLSDIYCFILQISKVFGQIQIWLIGSLVDWLIDWLIDYCCSVIEFVLFGGSVGGLVFLHYKYGLDAVQEILDQV